MRYTAVLLDFDGTVMQTGPGIQASLRHASEVTGHDYDFSKTWTYIGPPVDDFARIYLGLGEEEARQYVQLFRDFYRERSWRDSALYPGMRELMLGLRERGVKVYIATSKPEKTTLSMVDYFDIPVDGVSGSHPERGLLEKDAIIREGGERFHIDLTRAVMVGDAPRDILGGRACGTDTIAVLYGYGLREELLAARPTYAAETVGELSALLLEDGK